MKECYIRFLAGINQYSTEYLLKIIDTKLADNYTRIHLMINSPGGSVAHGLLVYNFLRSFPTEIYTYNIGSVDSIGVVVFCSGNRRFSVPNSRFLIHPVQLNVQGNHIFDEHSLQEHAKSITIDQRNIISVLAQTTGQDAKEVEKKLHERTTFTAEEAKKQRLVDIITDMPFIPANAEIIPVPESSAYPQNMMQTMSKMQGIPQALKGAKFSINDNYTTLFKNGFPFTGLESSVWPRPQDRETDLGVSICYNGPSASL